MLPSENFIQKSSVFNYTLIYKRLSQVCENLNFCDQNFGALTNLFVKSSISDYMKPQNTQPADKKFIVPNLIDMKCQQVVTIILKLAEKESDKFKISLLIM